MMLISAAEILEIVESFFLMIYLSDYKARALHLIQYNVKHNKYILRIKGRVDIFELVFIGDNILEIRAYNKWVTREVVQKNIQICDDLKKSFDYHHFIYKIEDASKVMEILLAFDDYIKEAMRGETG